ncbi:unnamed protein product [Bemisia tabaci]|uniref:Uncharacterized protein n=1 Tax=Bemisia tabaci TaxID=7038 RepID=A0A9P0CHM7_BEMTA|nr:unnamed protein product [Bemisia tabaci]
MASVNHSAGHLLNQTVRNRFKNQNTALEAALALFIICQILSCSSANTCNAVFKIQTNVYPVLLNLTEDQRLCIEDEYGESISLLFTNLTQKTRYKAAYYTSDYDVILKTQSNTLCSIDTNEGALVSYWCDTTNSTECSTSTKVCSTSTELIQKGELYDVYHGVPELEFQVSGFNFTSGSNYSQVVTVCEDGSFQLNLQGLGLLGVKNLTLSIAGWDSQVSRSLLRYGEEIYYVDSAPVGCPESGVFGEYQSDGKNAIYATPKVTCSAPLNCACECTLQPSAIGALNQKGVSHLQQAKQLESQGDDSLVEAVKVGHVWVKLEVAQLDMSLRRYVADMRLKSTRNWKITACDLYSWDKARLIKELGFDNKPSCYILSGSGNEHHTLSVARPLRSARLRISRSRRFRRRVRKVTVGFQRTPREIPPVRK